MGEQPVVPFDVGSAPRRFSRARRRELRAGSLLLPPGSVHVSAPPDTTCPRLAMYLRVSRHADDSVSIRRQFDECMREVGRLGGTLDPRVDVFEDVDVSASSGQIRAGMERLLARVREERAYDGVVVWELPRALRNQVEAANLRQVLVEGSCDLHIVAMPEFSLWGPSSFFFDYWVMLAQRESRAAGERIRSAKRVSSVYGSPRHRPVFGMVAADGDRRIAGRTAAIRQFVPDEQARAELGGRSRADLVRELVAAVLAGGTLHAVARRWNADGYPSPTGVSWSGTTLSGVLESPTLAGLAHRGYRLLGADGEPLKDGSDEAPLQVGVGVVDTETWLRVRAVFEARRTGPRGPQRLTLASLLRCGRCGGAVNRRGEMYACADVIFGSRTCGRSNRMMTHLLEPAVFDAAARWVRSRGPGSLADADDVTARLDAEIDTLHQALADVEELWLATSVVDADASDRFARRRAQLESRLTACQAQLTSAVRGSRVGSGTLLGDASSLEHALTHGPLDQRLMVLAGLVERVVLHPRAPGSRSGPSRLEVEWRSD